MNGAAGNSLNAEFFMGRNDLFEDDAGRRYTGKEQCIDVGRNLGNARESLWEIFMSIRGGE